MQFGVLLSDGAEPIDLGAYGTFSIAQRFEPLITLCTISGSDKRELTLAGGLRVLADHLLDDAPPCDAIIVAGGSTWPDAATDKKLLEFLSNRQGKTILAAACMGVMPLVSSGVLNGRAATCRNQTVGAEANPIERINRQWPAVRARAARIVDVGDVVTGGGGLLNVDLALHLLTRLHSRELPENTARILEYREAAEGNRIRLGDSVN